MKLRVFFWLFIIIITHLIAAEKQKQSKVPLLYKLVHPKKCITKNLDSSIWNISEQYSQRPKRFITLTEHVSFSTRATKQYKKAKRFLKKIATKFYRPLSSIKQTFLQKNSLK